MVECLSQDRGAKGSSLTGVTTLCPWARHINPSLELVDPRKTCPYLTERLLMGLKESNQAKQKSWIQQDKVSGDYMNHVATWKIGFYQDVDSIIVKLSLNTPF